MNNMDVVLALLADYANATREGKLNVMGIFSVINTLTLPCVHPQMQLVLEMEAGPAEWDSQKDVQITLMDEDGNKILTVGGTIKVPRGQHGRSVHVNSIMTFGNVKFDKAGDYQFAILIGGETKKTIPLRVNYVPPANPPGNS